MSDKGLDGRAYIFQMADEITRLRAEIERLTRERDDLDRARLATNDELARALAERDAASTLVEMRTDDLHNALARAKKAEKERDLWKDRFEKFRMAIAKREEARRNPIQLYGSVALAETEAKND